MSGRVSCLLSKTELGPAKPGTAQGSSVTLYVVKTRIPLSLVELTQSHTACKVDRPGVTTYGTILENLIDGF